MDITLIHHIVTLIIDVIFWQNLVKQKNDNLIEIHISQRAILLTMHF